MVREHEGEYASRWAALTSIAEKFGCNPETLRNWLRQAERDEGTAEVDPGFGTGASVSVGRALLT
ncbi:hypothetical protein CKO28_21100 [Rhodovibrio sodomensis]|uniref:Transposase n=1 Tax=Rhodovibrio sodomensis TaxID=1088 RepID=A0ABS1DJ45_9PROT|nr:hypothetical protein [Rhodovibrio sodomensis]